MENILSLHGFFTCLQRVLRLEEHALLFLGVPCNSFTWISCSQHGRCEDNDFMGNRHDYDWVETMNIVATRAALCIALAIARRCYFMIENPKQSCLPSFPYFDYLLQICHQLDHYAGVSDRTQFIYWCLTCSQRVLIVMIADSHILCRPCMVAAICPGGWPSMAIGVASLRSLLAMCTRLSGPWRGSGSN